MFWGIVLAVLGFVLFFAVAIGLLLLWLNIAEGPILATRRRDFAMGSAASIVALLICSGLIYALVQNISDDGSDHCGPGTRYVSESHYSPATKTTVTDWMCVAP